MPRNPLTYLSCCKYLLMLMGKNNIAMKLIFRFKYAGVSSLRGSSVRGAPPLRSWVSTNDICSTPLDLLCSGLRADETCQLQVSSIISMRDHYASPVQKGYIYKYACICIFITMILLNCPTLSMDSMSMCRLGSFSQCSSPDRMQNFVRASLLFSRYTSSLLIAETCIRRTVGRCYRNFASDPEQSMGKRTQSTHTRVGLGPIFTYQQLGCMDIIKVTNSIN